MIATSQGADDSGLVRIAVANLITISPKNQFILQLSSVQPPAAYLMRQVLSFSE
jgi:hypothetical protein